MEFLPLSFLNVIPTITTQVAQFENKDKNIIGEFLEMKDTKKIVVRLLNTSDETEQCYMFSDKEITVKNALKLLEFNTSIENLWIENDNEPLYDDYLNTSLSRVELSKFDIKN